MDYSTTVAQMQTSFSSHVDADDKKHAAFLRARMQNQVLKSQFTAAQILVSNRIAASLEECYPGCTVYTNFRKTQISIKVANFRFKDVKAEMLQYLEEGWEEYGVTKKSTPQGVIYCLPKH